MIKSVFYTEQRKYGNTLSVVPGKVRASGGEWTDIVN